MHGCAQCCAIGQLSTALTASPLLLATPSARYAASVTRALRCEGSPAAAAWSTAQGVRAHCGIVCAQCGAAYAGSTVRGAADRVSCAVTGSTALCSASSVFSAAATHERVAHGSKSVQPCSGRGESSEGPASRPRLHSRAAQRRARDGRRLLLFHEPTQNTNCHCQPVQRCSHSWRMRAKRQLRTRHQTARPRAKQSGSSF